MSENISNTPPSESPPNKPQRDPFPMLCHLSALATFVIPFGNFLGPLVVWLIKKDSDQEVEAVGREVLSFQGSVVIYFVGAMIFTMIPVIGWIIGPFILLIMFVLFLFHVIKASVASNKGDFYEYPYKLSFVQNIIDNF